MRRDPRQRNNANAYEAENHSPVVQVVCARHDVVHVTNKAVITISVTCTTMKAKKLSIVEK